MAFRERLNERRKTFKQKVDVFESRRRREDEACQIRKREKDEQMSRRRRLVELSSDICDTTTCLNNIPIEEGIGLEN